ncbi:MAG: hypothetical protein M3188_05205 [Actinomycetota bacterium]|nr:hypothetical protein [Actinomycetota bacterium]
MEIPIDAERWRANYGVWLDEMRTSLQTIGLAVHERRTLAAVRDVGVEQWEGGVLAESLESLRECAGFDEMLSNAPAPFLSTARRLARSCPSFRAGAELAERGIAENETPLFEDATAQWRRAANLTQSANRKLERPEWTEALPLPVENGPTRMSRIEPLFTRVAYILSEGGDFAARCWSADDWNRIEEEEFGPDANLAGFASTDYGSLNLAPRICDALAALAYGGERPQGIAQLDAGFALVVLMHETSHLAERGRYSSAIGREEAAAECWAMQFVRPAARALGVDPEYAGGLAERYWNEVYPRVDARYRSAECRNGGKLDARPTSDTWP